MGLWGCNIKASTWCCNLAVPWGALTLMMLLEEMEFSPWRWKMLEVFVSCTVYQCISYIRIHCVQIYIFHSLLIIYIYIFAIRTSIAATSTHRSPFLKASNLWSEKHLSSKGLGLERITCFFFRRLSMLMAYLYLGCRNWSTDQLERNCWNHPEIEFFLSIKNQRLCPWSKFDPFWFILMEISKII